MTETMQAATDTRAVVVRRPSPMGPAEIVVDGRDVADEVIGLQINMTAGVGEPTEVMLALRPGSTLFEGEARVVIGEQPDPGPAAATFLEAMDAETLQNAALNRTDLDSGPTATTEAILRQLIEWANGRA